METRTPEEELEYRRYLRKRIRMRKRRRKVMLARAVVLLVLLVVVFGVFYGVGWLTGPIGGSSQSKTTATEEPKVTPLVADIPEGYKTIYDKLYAMREEYSEMDDILLNIGQYPKDVLRLLVHNTETLGFVSDYLMHVDDEEASGGITEEETAALNPPLFQQWDKRWGYVQYGSNIIAINGCGPTCMSMVYTGLTGDLEKSPAQMAEYCIENGYYTEDSGTSWSLMLNGARQLGLQAERLAISQKAITEKLQSGGLIICSMKPGDFTTTGHFIVLRGVTEEGKLLINDPNSISRSNTEWELDTVLKQVKAAWAYSYTKQ